MLASPRDYLYPIHIPMMAIIAIGWLWGGSWLLLRSLKARQYPKRIKMSNCVLIMLLAGVAGVITAGAVYMLFNSISQGDLIIRLTGMGVGLVSMIIVSVFVIYAMLEFSLTRAVSASLVPMGSMLALILIVGVAAAIPAYSWRKAERMRDVCDARLFYVFRGLADYQQRYAEPPESLEVLVEKNIVAAEAIVCPGRPDAACGFFYLPIRVAESGQASETMLACDLAGNHDDGRNVLLINGQRRWCDTEEFRQLLGLEVNKDFAEALGKAEGGQ